MSKINLFVACAPVARMNDVTFDVKAEKGCSGVALIGAVKSDFVVEDANGSAITDFTVVETAGTYAFDVVTGESVVYIDLDGNRLIASTIYTSETLEAKV